MLDSAEDVCAGQARFEYPATSVLFSSCLLTVVAGPPRVLDGSQLGRLAGRDLAADPEGLGHQLPGAGQTVFILEFLEDPDGALGLRLGVGRPAIQVADEVQPCPSQ
jgi:hypothetical protein